MQPKLNVETVSTADLIPYAGNAKEHPDWQVRQIVESIKRFGFNDPIGVWHDADGQPIIVEGHGRVLAAKELGIDEVPVISLDHLDDEGRRAYTLVHNQITMDTAFDPDVLASELASLSGIEMEDFGFELPSTDDADFEPINDTESGPVASAGKQITWDGHSVTIADDELEQLNTAYDDYLAENGVTLGLFRSIFDASR